jgi:TonB family protein
LIAGVPWLESTSPVGVQEAKTMGVASRVRVLILALGTPIAALGANAPTPLAGNKPCAYPARAMEEQVGGAVGFLAAVLADGSVGSVEIRSVPALNLGFEESVRACVSEWRFDSVSSAYEPPRVYEGRLPFRRAPAEETFVRLRLEELADAWNARDPSSLELLAVRPDEVVADLKGEESPLFDRVQRLTREGASRLVLAADVDLFWFLSSDAVKVHQRYAAVPQESTSEHAEPSSQPLSFDAVLTKGPRGWRFAALVVAPPALPPAEPLRIGSNHIPEPKKIKNAAPVYPGDARASRVEGTVVLEATISPEGRVTNLKVVRGIPLLDTAAVEAVRQWRYTPTMLNGRAVPVIMTVSVTFRLQ